MQRNLSAGELHYVSDGFSQGVRADGRGLLDLRHILLRTGTLPLANGSAHVRLAYNAADLLVGVKLEAGAPSPNAPSLGRVEVSVDCSALVPSCRSGGGSPLDAERRGSELSNGLQRVLEAPGSLDLAGLCIIPGEVCWVIYIDAVVLAADGDLTFLLSLAALAALSNARVPKVTVFTREAPEGSDSTDAVESDFEVEPDPAAAARLDISGLPLTVTLSQIGGAIAVDLDAVEECCADARLAMSFNQMGNLCGMQTRGTGGVIPATLHAALRKGQELAAKLHEVLRAELLAEATGKLALETHSSFFVREEESSIFL